MAKKGGLGKGFDLLLDENATDNEQVVTVNINEIEPNRDQPRKVFDEAALNELADSISVHGLIQPILVRPLLSGRYSIIAGERRWRACRIAGLTEIPVIVKALDEKSSEEIAMIENLQREDLNPVEEALGYKNLIERHNLTQEDLSARVGKSRSAIANALRLLNLPENMLDALSMGQITAGHARAILSTDNASHRELLFKMALEGNNVRTLEAAAKSLSKGGNGKVKPQPAAKPTFFKEVELSLKNELGRKVTVKSNGGERGTITLEFFNADELKDFANKLAGKK
ncbi:MAG: ParB/RepB/Spo0J family partition protein [Clostridia bacterium]|nr:ParB/RepB/Spo0J family partition protein [Clostridia bacterium]